MEYRIIDFNETLGSATVLYTHEGRDIGAFGIEIPIVEGAFITGTALEEFLMSHAPTWILEKENSLKTVSNAEEIKQLIVPLVNPEDQAEQANMIGNIKEDYLRALIYQVMEEVKDSTV